MNPGKYSIKFYRGTTLDLSLTYAIDGVLVNLAGYTADMKVRPDAASTTLITEFSTTNGRIVLNATTGLIEITMTATDSALLPIGEYVYDLNVTSSGGVVSKLLRGGFVVLDPVTE